MTLLIASLAAFLLLYVVDRLFPLPAAARPALGMIGAALALVLLGRRDGTWARNVADSVAAGALGLVLSEVVAMLQAATDSLRVRVLSAATRRGRIPPI